MKKKNDQLIDFKKAFQDAEIDARLEVGNKRIKQTEKLLKDMGKPHKYLRPPLDTGDLKRSLFDFKHHSTDPEGRLSWDMLKSLIDDLAKNYGNRDPAIEEIEKAQAKLKGPIIAASIEHHVTTDGTLYTLHCLYDEAFDKQLFNAMRDDKTIEFTLDGQLLNVKVRSITKAPAEAPRTMSVVLLLKQ